MKNQFPMYLQSDDGSEQIKLINEKIQSYVRAKKFSTGFDYCTYKSILKDGELDNILTTYIQSDEKTYLMALDTVISFYESIRKDPNFAAALAKVQQADQMADDGHQGKAGLQESG